MQKKQSKFRKFLDGKGYYIALAVCVLAVGVSALVFYRTVSDVTEVEEPSLSVPATTKPAVIAPSTDNAETDKTTSQPPAAGNSVPTVALEQTPAAVRVCDPVEGETIAVYSVEALAYNETMGDWRTHNGVDIATPLGTKVYAVMDGTVKAVYDDDYLGTVVTVEHEEGWSTLYANLTAVPAVEAGDLVKAGQVIGAVGQSAMLEVGSRPHLHLEVYRYGALTDPNLLIG